MCVPVVTKLPELNQAEYPEFPVLPQLGKICACSFSLIRREAAILLVSICQEKGSWQPISGREFWPRFLQCADIKGHENILCLAVSRLDQDKCLTMVTLMEDELIPYSPKFPSSWAERHVSALGQQTLFHVKKEQHLIPLPRIIEEIRKQVYV